MKTRRLWLSAVLTLAANGDAAAKTAVTDDAKLTLYTFDKDPAGTSNGNDTDAQNWPYSLAKGGAAKGDGWTQIDRTYDSKQWPYQVKPAYLYREDTKPSDATDDGKGQGTWHILME